FFLSGVWFALPLPALTISYELSVRFCMTFASPSTISSSISSLRKSWDMQARTAHMQGVRRYFEPSQNTPLMVIIVDELAYLSFYMADKKLRERADKAIRTILTQGRAIGYSLVAAVQDPRIETCAYRNLFPVRIAGGLNEAKQVDMVLGEGSHDAGALCEQIPLGPAGAGAAYVLDTERMMKPRLIRAPKCSDEVIRARLQQVTTATPKDERDDDMVRLVGPDITYPLPDR
ncbi:MAG TPA: hypothetical protein VIZ18_17320, partial [Ktedonobacteraceae bacterium]